MGAINDMVAAGLPDARIKQAARFRKVMFTTKEQWLKDQAYYAFKARHWAAMETASAHRQAQQQAKQQAAKTSD